MQLLEHAKLLCAMLQLLFGLLQHFTVSQTVIVERNMFAYYRVPHIILFEARQQPFNQAQDSGMSYYILQCPPKRDETIPRPENMQTCNVIHRWPRASLLPRNVLSKLHTNVSYELQSKRTQPKRAKKLNQTKGQPYKIILRPLPLRYSWPKFRRFVDDQRSVGTTLAENVRSEEADLTPSTGLTDSIATDIENDENVDFYDGSSEVHEDDDDDDDGERTQNNDSVLKYLGVRDALAKLMQQRIKAPITFDSDNMSMHLSADHKNYTKGSRTKGYQNMYHRDESFKDHIFYDELKQNGKYETFDNSRHKTYK